MLILVTSNLLRSTYNQSHKKRSSDTSYQLSISGHYYLVFKIGIYKGSP